MNNEQASVSIRRALFLAGRTEGEVVSEMAAFRDFAAQVIKLAVPGAITILVGASSVRVKVPGVDAVRTLSLARLFHKLDPDAPHESLAPLVVNIGALMQEDSDHQVTGIEHSLSDIVPLLKSRAYAVGNARSVRQSSLAGGFDPDLHAKLSWDVNSEIVAYPVINSDFGYRFITGDQLASSDLTAKEIEAIAISNVSAIYEALPPSDYAEGSQEFSGLGGAASALVLVPDFLEGQVVLAGGPICLFSGDADHLFIVPLKNEAFLDHVLGKVVTGDLHLPEMPPLVYQDGKLEAAMIQQVNAPKF
jgi:uncharacterized protein YtpQ (UPF0354 family)